MGSTGFDFTIKMGIGKFSYPRLFLQSYAVFLKKFSCRFNRVYTSRIFNRCKCFLTLDNAGRAPYPSDPADTAHCCCQDTPCSPDALSSAQQTRSTASAGLPVLPETSSSVLPPFARSEPALGCFPPLARIKRMTLLFCSQRNQIFPK